jgi:hypothetical protein
MLTLKDALASSSDEDDVLALAQAELKSQGLYEQPVRQYNEAPKVVSKRKRHLEEKRTMKLNKLTNLNKCKHEGFCCKKNCRQFYTPSQVQLLRRSVHSRGAYDKRTFVKARIKVDVDAYNANQETRIGARDPIRTFTLDVCNHAIVDDMTILPLLCPEVSRRVCCRFFRFALGVSLNFIYQPTRRGATMHAQRKKRNLCKAPRSNKRQSVLTWLLQLAQWYQHQPDSNLVLLPFSSRSAVFKLYDDDCKAVENLSSSEPLAQCTSSWFKSVWRSSSATNMIRLRRHLRFSKCDVCVSIRKRKAKTQDPDELKAIRMEERNHHVFVMSERMTYYNRRKTACDKPQSALSLIIDGADWQQYHLPFYTENCHSSGPHTHWHTHTHTHTTHTHTTHTHTLTRTHFRYTYTHTHTTPLTKDALWRVPVYLLGCLVHGRHVSATTG